MTKAEITEQELTDMGVRIVHCPWLRRKAIATADGYVGVGQTADSRETHIVLAHEKQHYRLRAFYTVDADLDERRRSEARVNRALLHELCPAATLRRLLRAGFTVSEIAEELEITEELVTAAYDLYCAENPNAFRGKR